MNPNVRKMIHVCCLFLLLFGLIQISTVSANSQRTQDSDGALNAALSYLSTQQLADGGITGLAGTSDPATSARLILALSANEVNPLSFVNSEGISVVAFLSENYMDYVYDQQGVLFPGNAGLVLAALGSVEQVPSQLVTDLTATFQEDGSYATQASADFTSGAVTDLSQAFSIIGLINANQEIPPQAIEYLINRQAEDGTWDNGFGSDPDTTAIVLIALIGSDQVDSTHPAIQSALEYFRSSQLENGAWKPGWDTDPLNVDTTGWISHALLTAGEEITTWVKGGNNPLSALLSQQLPDGSIGGTYVNAYSTIEALYGLADFSMINLPVFAPLVTDNGNYQAALVIQLSSDTIIQQCIPFEGDQFSGADLLNAANLNLEVAVNPSMGTLVCGIEGTGCPVDNCFCDMPNYWSYWILTEGAWTYAQTGADILITQPGSVQGWSWGDTAPPIVEFSQICQESAESIATTIPTEINQTELVLPTETTEVITEEPQIETTQTVSPPEQPITNTILYFVFGGLLIITVVLIFVLSKRK